MYKYIASLMLLVFFTSCKDNGNSSNYNNDSVVFETMELEAMQKYNESPADAIPLFQKLVEKARELGDLPKAGMANLNLAGIYEETLGDYASAVKYSKAALEDWTAVDDKKEIANVLKYLGYVQGLNNNAAEGEMNINKAIEMYEGMDYLPGVAISHLNMAKVKLHQGDLTTALEYAKMSKSYWRDTENQARMFDANLVAIDIYKQQGKNSTVLKLINENKDIARGTSIGKMALDKFETHVRVEDK